MQQPEQSPDVLLLESVVITLLAHKAITPRVMALIYEHATRGVLRGPLPCHHKISANLWLAVFEALRLPGTQEICEIAHLVRLGLLATSENSAEALAALRRPGVFWGSSVHKTHKETASQSSRFWNCGTSCSTTSKRTLT